MNKKQEQKLNKLQESIKKSILLMFEAEEEVVLLFKNTTNENPLIRKLKEEMGEDNFNKYLTEKGEVFKIMAQLHHYLQCAIEEVEKLKQQK